MKLRGEEVKVLKFVLQNPDSNITSIAEGTGMQQPHVSRAVDELEQKGVVMRRKEGTQSFVTAVEGVQFIEGVEDEILVPSEIDNPFLNQLGVALRQHIDRRKVRNFDAMMRMIERDIDVIERNPWALEDVLNLYNVPPRITTIIQRQVYGSQRLEELKRIALHTREKPVNYGTVGKGTILMTGAGGPQVTLDIAKLAEVLRGQPSGEGRTITLTGERVIERRIEMETIRQPVLDNEGKPVMGPDGKPLIQEIQRPMVIAPQQPSQQWGPKEMYENLVKPILEQAKSPERPEKTLNEDKLVEKISREVKEPLEKRIDDMEQKWEREKAYREGYKEAAKEYGGARKPFEHYKLDVQKDLIEKGLINEVRGMRSDLKDFGLLHYAALIEERRGMAPGTLLTPLMDKLGLGGVLAGTGAGIEQPTTLAEKRAFIAKLRAD